MLRTERANQISYIQLKKGPYIHSIKDEGVKINCNLNLDLLAHNCGYIQSLPGKLKDAEEHLQPLFNRGYLAFDEKLKHGQDLNFSEAFSLVTFVASSLNKPLRELTLENIVKEEIKKRKKRKLHDTHLLQSVSLLSGMSTKEAYAKLTAEEIAGMVAATIHLDTVARISLPSKILSFGGMGGDQGYALGEGSSKLFSLSTLGAIASSIIGPTHKHHSYPNTSKIAGQSAIEHLGARSDFHSISDFEGVFNETNLLMSSCHDTRTLHTLSHLLKGETINHVIGPLAFTLSSDTSAHGFIGVNEKIHPETVIQALQILDRTGYQAYDNSAVYCGTDLMDIPKAMLNPELYYASKETKQHIRLDEIAPPPYSSLVAFLVDGQSVGTFSVRPQDFYSERELKNIRLDQLVVPNIAKEILRFNREALSGRDEAKSRYLAMTIGLGIFVRKYLGESDALNLKNHRVNPRYLRMATEEGLELLKSGKAMDKKDEYVMSTKKYAGTRSN